jgi:nucleoside-diphosphate-sugar epimerase
MSALIAVTGATGFLGQAVVRELASRAFNVRAVVRTVNSGSEPPDGNITPTIVGEINSHTDWSTALTDVDGVIHCAGRAHVMHETAGDAVAAYRAVNVCGARRLAEQAAASGVRRFVFLSSVKVNGETTDGLPRPFGSPWAVGPSHAAGTHNDAPREDLYGVSKWEAEQALWEVSAKTGLEVVVVRSPLIYGPGVKGNLARLLKLVRLGLPLPLSGVQNKRSLIGLDNLVDLLIRCVDHSAAAGQTFLVSDGKDLSTPDLIRHMAAAMGRSARLFPVPVSLLRLTGSALGKQAEIDRLVGSLQIDSSHTRQVLGWSPPVSVRDGIWRMVQGA